MGKNWDSRRNTWNEIKGEDTLKKVELCNQLRTKGMSVEDISRKMGLSKSRIYEYLRN